MPADSRVSSLLALSATALLWTAIAAAAWLALVAWRPTTTWHLAPALVASAGAWVVGLAGPEDRAPRRSEVAAVVAAGLAVALGELAAFDAAGRLLGPALFGGSVVAESAAAAILGVAAALIAGLRRSTRLGESARP